MKRMTDGESEFPDGCSNCDFRISVEEWHPVVAEPNGDGEPTFYSFCDDECKAAWSGDD